MENYGPGLVTHSEKNLLFDQAVETTQQRDNVIAIIARELIVSFAMIFDEKVVNWSIFNISDHF